MDADVIIVGHGLAGLVVAYELVRAGKRVVVVDQENRENLGGQAWWSLGGLFLVDTPEQRRLGIRDSYELAMQDWSGSAGYDSPDDQDRWGPRWAEAYVRFAATEKRDYLHRLGLRLLPFVGWAERGRGLATEHGNSVPRFHLTWGTGPEVVRVFAEPVVAAEGRLVAFRHRHRVDELIVEDGHVAGVRCSLLEPSGAARGVASSRTVAGSVELRAPAVVVTSGGIGHNAALMRDVWPTDVLGRAPEHLVMGVPAYVDGRMLGIAEAAGGRVVNRSRLWAYTEGIHNWDPVWPGHGIRILPGPSSLWLDANGRRLRGMSGVPGADTRGALRQILATGFDYSWFVLTQSIIAKEFALSGSEQNPDFTGKDVGELVRSRLAKGAPAPVEAFKRHGEDFVVADTLPQLVAGMNRIARGPGLDPAEVERVVVARDRELGNPFGKDLQLMVIANARRSLTDKVIRVAPPHRLLDPAHGPLIAVRLNILSRKTLGGLQTDLDSRVLGGDGEPVPGLYAAGEVAGFGGGGLHGHNALEGTFLGGCIFSGRAAGRALGRESSRLQD